ncbi:MAG TPA: M17 family peptidase N-terminal domain-containing protein, partial [Desulfotignum sp.]|nr:M17 family peptidase N-terminal domain-containing protein [Desulfotignum sp.]
MENTRLTITEKPVDTFASDLVVYFAAQRKDMPPVCDPKVEDRVKTAHELGDFSGKMDEELLYYPDGDTKEKKSGGRRILVLGMGKEEPDTDPTDFLDILRRLGGNTAKACEKTKAKTLVVCIPHMAQP